jgi:hypothetical protein
MFLRALVMTGYKRKYRSLGSEHPVNPVHPVESVVSSSDAESRNLDRISKMNRMYGCWNRWLGADHPVSPVIAVQNGSF